MMSSNQIPVGSYDRLTSPMRLEPENGLIYPITPNKWPSTKGLTSTNTPNKFLYPLKQSSTISSSNRLPSPNGLFPSRLLE